MPEPITFREALAAMWVGARVIGRLRDHWQSQYRISGGNFESLCSGSWAPSILSLNDALRMQWFRLESSG